MPNNDDDDDTAHGVFRWSPPVLQGVGGD